MDVLLKQNGGVRSRDNGSLSKQRDWHNISAGDKLLAYHIGKHLCTCKLLCADALSRTHSQPFSSPLRTLLKLHYAILATDAKAGLKVASREKCDSLCRFFVILLKLWVTFFQMGFNLICYFFAIEVQNLIYFEFIGIKQQHQKSKRGNDV